MIVFASSVCSFYYLYQKIFFIQILRKECHFTLFIDIIWEFSSFSTEKNKWVSAIPIFNTSPYTKNGSIDKNLFIALQTKKLRFLNEKLNNWHVLRTFDCKRAKRTPNTEDLYLNHWTEMIFGLCAERVTILPFNRFQHLECSQRIPKLITFARNKQQLTSRETITICAIFQLSYSYIFVCSTVNVA